MIDKRNELELKLHGLVEDILYILEEGKVSRPVYQDMVGRLRNIKVMLVNKQFGCPSGAHSSTCHCV
jgi:hypothetical protein